MKIFPSLPRPAFLALPAMLLCTGWLASCNLNKNKDAPQYANNGSYATYPADGHYHPYPAGSTPPATSSTQSQYQPYNEAPPPPSKSKKSSTTKKSSGTTASTTKKKTPGTTTISTASHASSGTVYTVKQSDTLYGISRKYHVTVSKLKSANNLTSDIIRPGMKLKIP